MQFFFYYNTKTNLIKKTQSSDKKIYHKLVTHTKRQIATTPRKHPHNVKNKIIHKRYYKMLRQTTKNIIKFSYQPNNYKRYYQIITLHKNISIKRNENILFYKYHYFFYITNYQNITTNKIINQTQQRYKQKNLINQLKSNVHTLHTPINTLCTN